MRRMLVATITALLVVTGCGSEDPEPQPEEATSSPSEEPSPTAEPTTDAPTQPPAPANLVVVPGAVGPVRAGMSKADALKTGLFNADVPPPVEGCPP